MHKIKGNNFSWYLKFKVQFCKKHCLSNATRSLNLASIYNFSPVSSPTIYLIKRQIRDTTQPSLWIEPRVSGSFFQQGHSQPVDPGGQDKNIPQSFFISLYFLSFLLFFFIFFLILAFRMGSYPTIPPRKALAMPLPFNHSATGAYWLSIRTSDSQTVQFTL